MSSAPGGAAPPGPPGVAARDVVRAYGERRALERFSLAVPAGSVFGLLGPNGSGKSTFVTLVAAMTPPDEGQLLVFGEPPAAALRGRVGVVFQENAQDPLMTVEETLALAGRIFGVPRGQLRARGEEVLRAFGLYGRAGEPVSTLSGGMRRRLEMARALLHEPELLLLDEPTTGVDAGERQALWEQLLARRGQERTILLATNDLAEADSVCDKVAFVRDGAVVATGTLQELKRGLRRESVRVMWPGVDEATLGTVGAWPGTGTVSREGDTVHITVDDGAALVPRLFELAPGQVRAVSIERSTLEDVYFQYVSARTRHQEAVA